MSTNVAVAPAKKLRKKSQAWDTAKRVFRYPSAKVGGVIFVIIVLLAILAPLIAPYGPYEMHLDQIFQAPSGAHWFGTDGMGRDILSRMLYGTKYSLALGIICSFTGNALGVILGSIAGYFGGIVEDIIMRFCDIWSAIPGILLTIILSATLGPGFFNTVLALSIGHFPQGARMTRGMILAERSKEYIEAAESINTPKVIIMFKHLLPPGPRRRTPGNWLWYMDKESGRAKALMSLQCMNAVGALDRFREPTDGTGCCMHDGINSDKISSENNGKILYDTDIEMFYIPANVDPETIEYKDFFKYNDKEAPDFRANGGWIIWHAHDSEEGIISMVGPCKFYTSGMYHYGSGENDYYHLMMAAVKAEPSI